MARWTYEQGPIHHYELRQGVLISNVRERIRNRDLDKKRIKVDIRMFSETTPEGVTIPKYHRNDVWTGTSAADLITLGYQKVKGMPGYDSIVWWGVPIFVKLHGAQQFDIHQVDEHGQLIYSQDSPGTLDDERKSTAVRDFIKGMFRTSYDKMDLQKLAMVALLGIGAVFGLMMLGVI